MASDKEAADLDKQKRLEAALRANLKRRKAQQREREAAAEPKDGD